MRHGRRVEVRVEVEAGSGVRGQGPGGLPSDLSTSEAERPVPRLARLADALGRQRLLGHVARRVQAPLQLVGALRRDQRPPLQLDELTGDVQAGTDAPAQLAAHGAGCAGSLDVPELAADGGDLPWPGDVLQSAVTDAGGAVAACAVGFSDVRYGGAPLPLDLTPLGLPGCALHVAPDLVELLPIVAGRADWPLAVPARPELLAVTFHAQAAALDAAANPFGAALSNAVRAMVGAR